MLTLSSQINYEFDFRCDGCHYRIMVALHIGYSVALVVFACVVLVQVLGIALTLYTVFQTKREIRVVFKLCPIFMIHRYVLRFIWRMNQFPKNTTGDHD